MLVNPFSYVLIAARAAGACRSRQRQKHKQIHLHIQLQKQKQIERNVLGCGYGSVKGRNEC